MRKSFKQGLAANLASPDYRDLREERPEGWLLAHNYVRRTARSRGMRNFRAFWAEPASHSHFVICDCGWRPELGVHYRRPEV